MFENSPVQNFPQKVFFSLLKKKGRTIANVRKVCHNVLQRRLKVMVMVMHLYSAFSMWIYSNALYNTLWGTLPDCLIAQFTIFLM